VVENSYQRKFNQNEGFYTSQEYQAPCTNTIKKSNIRTGIVSTGKLKKKLPARYWQRLPLSMISAATHHCISGRIARYRTTGSGQGHFQA